MNWISAYNQKPNPKEPVAILCENKNLFYYQVLGFYFCDDWYVFPIKKTGKPILLTDEIIEWMPMPEPYREN